MSGADRATFRVQVKSVLEADAYFADWTAAWAWSQTLDADQLPIYAVATPQERREPDAHEVARCDLTLVVILKRLGGEDIEDLLDEAGDAAESAVIAAIRTPHVQCELSNTGVKIDGSGGQRVGTLDLTFGVTYWVENPTP